jgi:hypothetical protein
MKENLSRASVFRLELQHIYIYIHTHIAIYCRYMDVWIYRYEDIYIYIYIHIYVLPVQFIQCIYIYIYANGTNEKRKFVFLGRQTINGNRCLLYEQRAHLCVYYIYICQLWYINMFLLLALHIWPGYHCIPPVRRLVPGTFFHLIPSYTVTYSALFRTWRTGSWAALHRTKATPGDISPVYIHV